MNARLEMKVRRWKSEQERCLDRQDRLLWILVILTIAPAVYRLAIHTGVI